MKPFASIALIVAALAVILGLAIASARREARRLLEEFTATTAQRAEATVEVLSARLDALDQDTRILTDVVDRARRAHPPEPADARAELSQPAIDRSIAESAFNALVLAVTHYRITSLIRPDGTPDIVAVQPTELPAIVNALLPHMRKLAREVTTKRAKTLGEPAR